MQRREGNDSADSMIHRQSRQPLIVRIAANKLKKEINATNIKFKQIEDKRMDLDDKHDQDEKINIWEKIFQWQPIVAGIALILLMLIIILVIRRTFYTWTAQYLQTRHVPEYGPADIEEVEMMEVDPKTRLRQHSRPGIRTNPLKLYPALTNDRIDDKIQELIAYQQATGAGPQKGADVSVM